MTRQSADYLQLAIQVAQAMNTSGGGVRICPQRDAICPHGIGCPYSQDRYKCTEKQKEQNQ